jgi:hypothetical protein
MQKYKRHHLLLEFSTSRFKFNVILEIITVLKFTDNNVVLTFSDNNVVLTFSDNNVVLTFSDNNVVLTIVCSLQW